MSWQSALQSGFKTPEALLQYLNLDTQLAALAAHHQFKTRVPLSYAKRMRQGDKNCPLLRQVLPIHEECVEVPEFVLDPLQEKQKNPTPGILHKYHGRVLVMLSISCAINCRYCFRRHFPYEENQVAKRDWQSILDYLVAHQEVHEVILSGGDPLMLSHAHLTDFIERLEQIKTVKTIRFHTRLPVVIPERIDKAFLGLIEKTRFQYVMVLHINHANELCDDIRLLVEALKQRQVSVLNQSVLLKGVNDNEEALIGLSHALFEHGILPYYLHLLDKVTGTAHFDVKQTRAQELFQAMQEALPGYLVPKLVRESPDRAYKVLHTIR